MITQEAPPRPSDLTPPASRAGRDWVGFALAAYAFLLPVAFTSQVFGWYVIPKLALSLIILGPGLVALGRFVARRDLAACCAAAFLTIAGVATLLADAPMMSLFGEYFSVNGWLFLAITAGVWALGRAAKGRERLIENAILATAAVNAAVGWLELSTTIHLEGIGPYHGRAPGLMANPAFFAALCSGALWIALSRARRAPRPLVPLVLVGFLIGAVELAASRISLVASVLVILGFLVAHIYAREWRRAAALAAVVIVGFGLAQLPAQSGSTGAQRVQADSSGIGTRVLLWQDGLEGFVNRPLLGYGPGRSQVATTPRRSLKIAQYEGPDTLYSDTHNFLVEELVTTGALGFLALAAWLVLAVRRARGPLAGFAAIAAVAMLFEPQFIGLTPLVMLALGAATARAPDTKPVDLAFRDSRPLAWLAIGLAVAGLGAGGLLMVGDSHYYQAVIHGSLPELDAAATTMPPWPQLPGVHAQLIFGRARQRSDPKLGRSALAYERQAAHRDPADPRWANATGVIEETFGTAARANAAYRHALQLNPWSFQALAGLYRVAARDGNRADAIPLRTRLCRLGPNDCPPRSTLPR